MSVNRIKIRLNATGDTAGVMNIPISLQSQPIGQAEIIEREFISKEIAKTINPIVDYEKTRFLPVVDVTSIAPVVQLDTIEYNINLLNATGSSIAFGVSIYSPTLYKGFTAKVSKTNSALTVGVNNFKLSNYSASM